MIEETPGIDVDYLAVVDPETFLPPGDFRREVLLAGAVRIGRTRLIDNVNVRRSQILTEHEKGAVARALPYCVTDQRISLCASGGDASWSSLPSCR